MCRWYGVGRATLRARSAGSAASGTYGASSAVCVCARFRNVHCALVRGFAPDGAAAVRGRCAGTELHQQAQQQSQLVLWLSGKDEGGRSRGRGVEPQGAFDSVFYMAARLRTAQRPACTSAQCAGSAARQAGRSASKRTRARHRASNRSITGRRASNRSLPRRSVSNRSLTRHSASKRSRAPRRPGRSDCTRVRCVPSHACGAFQCD